VDHNAHVLAFLLSPRSAAPWQVGKELYEQARFRKVLQDCDDVIGDRLGWSLLSGMGSDGGVVRRPMTEPELEPAVTALQIAMSELWRECGISPDAVAGASGGEFAAAFVAGALSLEDAMTVACCAGQVFGSGLTRGGTIAVSMSRADAEAYLPAAPKTVFLASHHSRGNVALSGDPEAIAAVSADLSRRNVRWRPVPTSTAVHSPIMNVHEQDFLERLRRLHPRPPAIPIYSAAAGGPLKDAAFDARHWWSVFREPAYFADAAARLLDDGFDTFVDFGLQPVLSGAIQEEAEAAGKPVRFLPPASIPGGPAVSAPDPAAFDPGSPDVRRDPYPHYHRLRALAPVLFLSRAGYWAVLRHEDVTRVLKEPTLFSSSILRSFDPTLLGADPPAHTRTRQLVTEAFTPRKLEALEAHIRSRTDQLLDGIAGKSAFDLVAAVAMPLPVSVIAEMLGMSTEDLDRLKGWSDAVVSGASGRPSPDERARIAAVGAELGRFLADHVARLQADPDDSLLGNLVVGPARLPASEAASLARLLLVAGNETTTNLIGNAVLALLRNPAELARLKDDRALVPAAIEETLRYDAPVQTVDRVTTQPVELAGICIPAQARVGVMIGAANRDPSVFPNPDTFSITRDPHGHVAFGAGPHYCLGSFLARLEARIVIEGLLDRLPQLRAVQSLDEVELTRSLHLRGPRLLMLAGPGGV
jgi:cytochrome P450